MLRRDDVEVVDIATHTAVRPPLIEAALKAGKHVLSQKPFVTDLDVGERLADLADKMGVKLAVNQNARWAPHFSYMREAVRGGLVGDVEGIHCDVHWDHSWVKGTAFETYAAFDPLRLRDSLVRLHHDADERRRADARLRLEGPRDDTRRSPHRCWRKSPIEYPTAQASLVFDGHTRFGRLDRVFVAGSARRDLQHRTRSRSSESGADDGRRRRAAQARRLLVPRRLPRHDGRAALRRSKRSASR